MSDLLVVSLVLNDGTDHQLEDPANGYEVAENGYGAGKSSVRRQTVESDDVPGRVLLAWTRDVMLGSLSIVVKGTTAAVCKTRVDALTALFDQVDYTLTATLASTSAAGNWVESWRCEPADWEIGDGGVIDNVLLHHFWQRVTFEWPHDPIAL